MTQSELYDKYDNTMADTCRDIIVMAHRAHAHSISLRGLKVYNHEHRYVVRCAEIVKNISNYPLMICGSKLERWAWAKLARVAFDDIDEIGATALDVEDIIAETKKNIESAGETFTIEDIYQAFIGSKEVKE